MIEKKIAKQNLNQESNFEESTIPSLVDVEVDHNFSTGGRRRLISQIITANFIKNGGNSSARSRSAYVTRPEHTSEEDFITSCLAFHFWASRYI